MKLYISIHTNTSPIMYHCYEEDIPHARHEPIRSIHVSPLPQLSPISERPNTWGDAIGDFEVDIVGSTSKVSVVAVLDKYSKHTWFHKIPN